MVLINEVPEKSCGTTLSTVAGKCVITIEGLGTPSDRWGARAVRARCSAHAGGDATVTLATADATPVTLPPLLKDNPRLDQ
jgi:hypothetical protein